MESKIRFFKTSLCSLPSINMKSNGKMKDSFPAILFWLTDVGNPNLLWWQWKGSIIMITEGKVGYPYPIHCTNKHLLTITTWDKVLKLLGICFKKVSCWIGRTLANHNKRGFSKLVREENTFYYLDNNCVTSSSMKLWFAFHFPSPQLPSSYFSKLPR